MKHTMQEEYTLPQYKGAMDIGALREILGFLSPEQSIASLDALLGTGIQPPRVPTTAEGEFLVVHGELLILTKRGNPVIIRKYDETHLRGIEIRAPVPEERRQRGRILEWFELSHEETRSLYLGAIRHEVLA